MAPFTSSDCKHQRKNSHKFPFAFDFAWCDYTLNLNAVLTGVVSTPKPSDIITSIHGILMFMWCYNCYVDALYEMERGGAAPVMYDGKVGGNGSCILSIDGKPLLIVSKTGKLAGKMNIHNDLCIVESFNTKTWTAEYYSASESIRPTSDCPMHNAALHLNKKFKWAKYPTAALHGHALETEEKAFRAHIPCSKEETLFSTPPDTEALLGLIKSYPYPENKIYVRKNHGFFILGDNVGDTVDSFKRKVLPYSTA